ncbi:hypothetical protein [Actinomadura sp. 9N407]|uniref:hypothetical protein n=1 Tax=Actinomadura sp. 9N407 TaxID=3375154 RepID=UPI0037A3F459
MCLGLRPHVLNPLKGEGVRTVGDLVSALDRDEVAGFRNVGAVALREIGAALVACGVVDEDHKDREPATVLAWVVREYYGGDVETTLDDLARLAAEKERFAAYAACVREGVSQHE